MDLSSISLEALAVAAAGSLLALLTWGARLFRFVSTVLSYMPQFREVMKAGQEQRDTQANVNARTVDMLQVLLVEIQELREDNKELQKKLNDCVGTGLDARIEKKLNGHSARPKSSPSLSTRNRAILKALKKNTPSEVATQFGLSTSTIYSIRKKAA